MEACEKGHTDIVKLLLEVPGVDVHAAQVSCVLGKRLHDGITMGSVTGTLARCEPEVWQDGSVRGRVSVEVDCVGGRL